MKLNLITNNYSESSFNFNNESMIKMITAVNKTITSTVNNLSTKLVSVNDTLSQKFNGLDADLKIQKVIILKYC